MIEHKQQFFEMSWLWDVNFQIERESLNHGLNG